MNADIRTLAGDAEHAARRGDAVAARTGFVEAGDCAVGYQLWRSAVRCYRSALEIDLVDRTAVERLVGLAVRIRAVFDWAEYARALDRSPDWPHFGCRGAQIVSNDSGAVVACPLVGPVLEILMTSADLVEARPDGRFAGMPLAMGLIVMRRALWSAPRDHAIAPIRVRVAFSGRPQVWLDELGEWEAA